MVPNEVWSHSSGVVWGTGTKWLIVEPICGLCNRLMVLASAWRLADLDGRRLGLIWANSCAVQITHSNCRFADLFENKLMELHSFDEIPHTDLARLVTYPRSISWDQVPGGVVLDPGDVDLSTYRDIPVVGITASHLLISRNDTQDALIRSIADFLLTLRPVRQTDEAIRWFRVTHFRTPMLGVHIRRGDHGSMLATAGVPQTAEEDFWAFVDACLGACSRLRVFCATDDWAVKQRFMDRYGERACTYPCASFDRSTSDGVREALVDLMLLSHADLVCGTPWSTFTQLASFRKVASGVPYGATSVELPAGIRHDPIKLSEVVTRTLQWLNSSTSMSGAS